MALPELPDGTIQAEVDTGIIPQSILQEVWLLKRKGIDLEDIVERLQPRTLPFGYTYHTWTPGEYLLVLSSVLYTGN